MDSKRMVVWVLSIICDRESYNRDKAANTQQHGNHRS